MDKIDELLQRSTEFVKAIDKAEKEFGIEKIQSDRKKMLDDVKKEIQSEKESAIKDIETLIRKINIGVSSLQARCNDICRFLLDNEPLPDYVHVVYGELVVCDYDNREKISLNKMLEKYDFQKYKVPLKVYLLEEEGGNFRYFLPYYKDFNDSYGGSVCEGFEFVSSLIGGQKMKTGGFSVDYQCELVTDIKVIQSMMKQMKDIRERLLRTMIKEAFISKK